jgi:hypothetical protein
MAMMGVVFLMLIYDLIKAIVMFVYNKVKKPSKAKRDPKISDKVNTNLPD